MNPRIETIEGKWVVGICSPMSAGGIDTAQLWGRFMPRRGEIKQRASANYLAMRVYHSSAGEALTAVTRFDEWAVVEVSDVVDLPSGMDSYSLPGGAYAVFVHRGPAETFPETTRYVYGVWLPNSAYVLDDRPHFAVMGPDYRPDDPEAEEELWVPIRPAP